MTNPYTFTDNPMVSGVSVCNTDIVNDNIMALKWMHDHISFRSIGEIVTSTMPLVDSGLHLLDGANIESGSYANFVSYIADLYNSGDYPGLFTTESDWQSTVTQYGVCGKFVYNSTNNTVKLPKVTGILEGTTDVTALGDLVEAGLPNITGNIGVAAQFYAQSYTDGAFAWTDTTFYCNGANGNAGTQVNFDASRLSSIYGHSETVQPQSIKVLYYIVIGTSTKTDIQVDIDNIATDLNGKADTDLLNVPESRGILVEKSSKDILPRWYRVYADGWCEQGGIAPLTSYVGVTVSLLKPFVNTDYVISPNIQTTESTGYGNTVAQSSSISYPDKTTSSFGIYTAGINNFNVNGVCWEAKGYIR